MGILMSVFGGVFRALLRVATWWNGATLNTLLYTWRKGVRVGEDEQGNVYYRTRDDSRRWVLFNGECEASRVSPDWHGWLHHTFREPPEGGKLPRRAWERPHEENPTGTALAHAPAGSIRRGVPLERRDYEAWIPDRDAR